MTAEPSSGYARRLDVLPMPGLDHHLDTGLVARPPTALDLGIAELTIDVHGHGARRDCRWTETYRGRNSSAEALRSVHLSSDTDFVTDESSLHLRCFDVRTDPERENPLHLVQVESDDFTRWVAVPLRGDGVGVGDEFAVELTYLMRGVVDPRIDYWFFDPFTKFSVVRRMVFNGHWRSGDLRQAVYLVVDRQDRKRRVVRRVPIMTTRAGSRCTLAVDDPDPAVVHVLLLGAASRW
jgi:hypothetical protein